MFGRRGSQIYPISGLRPCILAGPCVLIATLIPRTDRDLEVPAIPERARAARRVVPSSDPPWFFVSPYYKNGSLVTYLKGLPTLETADVLKVILEIAQGMEYLHCRGVLHGDLKVRSSEEATRTDISGSRMLTAG